MDNILNQIHKNSNAVLKNSALKLLEDNALPTTKNEYYKYTNISELYNENLDIFKTPNITVLANNVLLKELNEEDLKNYKNDFKPSESDFSYDSVLAMTHGLTQKVFELTINASSDKPIIINYDEEQPAIATTLIIKVNPNVKAELIERNLHKNHGVKNHAVKIKVRSGATLEHIILQNNDLNYNQYSNYDIEIKKDAHYKNINFVFGGHINRTNVHAKLMESGAEAEIHGLHFGRFDQHIDTMSFIEHIAPHTYSKQLYKSVLDDESRSAFMGRVKVHRKAQLIDSQQLNKNLLISKKARAHSLPQLEIFADDVKCAHGSTTGEMSDQELFYFLSRGINEKKARKMLALGFVKDLILKVSNAEIKEELEHIFLSSFESRLS